MKNNYFKGAVPEVVRLFWLRGSAGLTLSSRAYVTPNDETERNHLLSSENWMMLDEHKKTHTGIHKHKPQPSGRLFFGQQIGPEQKSCHAGDLKNLRYGSNATEVIQAIRDPNSKEAVNK